MKEEKIEENYWEIVEYKEVRNGTIWRRKEKGKWIHESGAGGFLNDGDIDRYMSYKTFQINSILIKSTNEVFKVGDKVVWDSDWYKIGEFAIIKTIGSDKNGIYLQVDSTDHIYRSEEMKEWKMKHYTKLETTKITLQIDGTTYTVSQDVTDEINKILQTVAVGKKGVLLVTEDSVNIAYHNYNLYGIYTESWNCLERKAQEVADGTIVPLCKWFSTEEARQQYIILHKPVISLSDIHEMHQQDTLNINKECDVRKWVTDKLNAVNK